jgi:Uma2 family endonuclease
MAIRSRSITYDDLQRMRESAADRLELIDGELFVTPSPSRTHQWVSKRLSYLLKQTVDDAGVGEFHYAPFDVKLADGSVVQPDLLVVLRERLSALTESGVEGAADFIVEIVSPSTSRSDHVNKRDLYARHGVREYWLVDADAHSVTVYSDPRGGRYLDERETADFAVSVIIPGLSVDLTELFSPFSDD